MYASKPSSPDCTHCGYAAADNSNIWCRNIESCVHTFETALYTGYQNETDIIPAKLTWLGFLPPSSFLPGCHRERMASLGFCLLPFTNSAVLRPVPLAKGNMSRDLPESSAFVHSWRILLHLVWLILHFIDWKNIITFRSLWLPPHPQM